MEQQLNSSTGGWICDDRRDEADFTSVSQTNAKPLVSGSFKHSMLDVWAFAEWTGQHYIRLHECWVHRFADQRNKDNWKDTGELWKLWWENYR